MQAASKPEGGNTPRKGLGRCLLFFWLGIAFDVVGASVLLLGVFTAAPYWDMLLYVGSFCCFVSLLWWGCWYIGNIELGPEGAGRKPLPPGLSFFRLVDTAGQSLAVQQTSTSSGFSTTLMKRFSSLLRGPQPLPSTRRSALLIQAIQARCGGNWPQEHRPRDDQDLDDRGKSQRTTDRVPGAETGSGQHWGAEAWLTKRCMPPGKMVVQPMSPAKLASPKHLSLLHPVQSLGCSFTSQSLDAAPAGPGLASGYPLPRQPLFIMTSSSMPSLSAAGASCPLHLRSSKTHPSLSLQKPPLAAVPGHLQQLSLFQRQFLSPPAIRNPNPTQPAQPTSLQSHLETAPFNPPPLAAPAAGAHPASSLIHASSRDSGFVHEPTRRPQRPGTPVPRTPLPEGQEPSVSYPFSIAPPDECR